LTQFIDDLGGANRPANAYWDIGAYQASQAVGIQGTGPTSPVPKGLRPPVRGPIGLRPR
jgi:hypothetical protein